jgi:dipeptidyl aminopeptidase/acylaminoacyl peptidase
VPPLIDRELLFGNPEVAGAQLSPDGRFVAFRKPFRGTMNVWVKRVEEPFDQARPLTADTVRPVRGYFWTRDGRTILFTQDKGGDENFNVYAVDPAAPPAAGSAVPAARDLTRLAGVRVQIVDVPKSDPDAIYVGLNDRDKAWHDLYRLRISTGERTLVRTNTDRITGWVFDRQGRLRLATRIAPDGTSDVLRVDSAGLVPVYRTTVFEDAHPIAFEPGGRRVYMVTNRGDADLARLVLLDPVTKDETVVESDPKGRVDVADAIFSERTDSLVATAYNDERERVYPRDSSFARDYRTLERRFPGANIGLGSSTADDRRWLVSVTSDVNPGEVYLFDRASGDLTLQYRSRPKLDSAQLATTRAITYKSSDGLEIPAFLTLPRGVAATNLPVVALPHGGPWARDYWGFNPLAQFLANRGYAVLQPNFRGSTGYGKRFLNAGNREWGQKMQDDITWGVRSLVAQGVADPKRVGIMGGSYGGYATLAGVTFTPDLYSAAVAIVAPSNLITLLQTIPPYWEAARVTFRERMGDASTPEGRAQLERQSPLNSADKIRTPLMVVQGANDPRVNKREADQIVAALQARHYPVEYLVAPDEGHGFARPVNNMAMFMAAERFLAKHLGGRYQAGGTPEVVARLAAITVDPATVKVVPRPTASTSSR